MAQTRTPNRRLAAVLADGHLSHASVARAFVRVALESGAEQFAAVARSHVSHWIAGTRPSGDGPSILREALSRQLGRVVTLDEIGFGEQPSNLGSESSTDLVDWRVDALIALTDLGRDDVDLDRRRVLAAAAYSVAVIALPGDPWWHRMAEMSASRTAVGSGVVGRGDVDAVKDMVSMFSAIDQRRGGGHARSAAVRYLTTDVARYLHGDFRDEKVRREMFTSASELAYLVGWMGFDNAEHASAQRFFTVAIKLAAEADDAPLAGHILRAMAHQALDLGHHRQAVDLATASVDGQRYTLASPRERALLGVVLARTLAVSERPSESAAALLRAENDLAAATPGDNEPGRVFFFGEASLSHETACALRDSGDLSAAAIHFRRSVRTRKASSFTRTHAVTLGYLGDIQFQEGSIEQACSTWSTALDAMDGVRSGRTRQVAANMRSRLSPVRSRGIAAITDIDARAATYLRGVA